MMLSREMLLLSRDVIVERDVIIEQQRDIVEKNGFGFESSRMTSRV
jgi:hypothetical protein